MKSIQIFLLALVASALPLVGAACATAPTEETRQQISSVAELSKAVGQGQQGIQESVNRVRGLEGRISTVERGMNTFVNVDGVHALQQTRGIPDPPSGKVVIRFRYSYKPQPLPGDGLQLYESTREVSTLWAMESLERGKPLPVGPVLKDNIFFLSPGESRKLTIALRNPTRQEVGFIVQPHLESPWNLAQHIWPTCLCMSMVYKAPAEGAWYRVINIAVSPAIPPGSKVDLLWTILTDPKLFPVMPGM